jgi:hypothetical protein
LAIPEYSLLIGEVVGGVIGGVQAYLCGGSVGSIIEGVAWGVFLGFYGTAAFFLAPTAANGVGLALSGIGVGAALYDKHNQGWNSCNRFTLALSLVGAMFSAGGLIRGGINYINRNLGGLGDYGVPDEFMLSSSWNEGYYSDTGPIEVFPYSEAEWSARIAITDKWGYAKCWYCARDMQQVSSVWGNKPDTVVGLFSKKYKTPLVGPGGTDIGAGDGWHSITIDRFGAAWDNWGWHRLATPYIKSILDANPGAFSKEFADVYKLLEYRVVWMLWH